MNNKVLSTSFLWMAIGLLVTFATGFGVYNSERILYSIFSGGMYWLFVIAEFVLVLVLSARVFKMKETTAKIMFLLYSFVSGLTFSSIFVVYEISSIIYVFLIAAAIYALFGFIGYTTKIDLTKIGTYLMMALFGIVIASMVNIFWINDTFTLIISIIALIVFLGITAYDVQKISKMPELPNAGIYGALDLYLDFINIFIRLLQLFGNSRD